MDLPNKSDNEPPKKEIKQIVQGKKADRPATSRFMHSLFAESPKPLMMRVGRQILIPRLKIGVQDALNGLIQGMLWGNGGQTMTSGIVQGTVLRGGATDYRAISSGGPSALQQAQAAVTQQSSGNYKDVVCDSQQRAEQLLAYLYDLINRYRMVAVGDLYEAAGITTAPSDNAFGWTALDGSRIVATRDGYVLQLPKPVLL